ncbi:hypothetical protein HDV01_007906 [Terramyces sp. JEL0728]|nr:hypothetical protein HDV01_007906 [Terramyces sp. JEL0728]
MSSKPITAFFKPTKKRERPDQGDKENVKKFKSLDFPDVWAVALNTEVKKPYFAKLMELVDNDPGPVYPPIEDRYTFMQCPIDQIKCVIIGQDPYHGKNQAHGLCFSVRKGVRIPPSLQNIYTELSNDIEGFVSPTHGCLENWVNEGLYD